MQFLTGLFGGSENTLVTAVLSLGIVLLLIVSAVWLLKFTFRASTNASWGRNRRLMLVDSMNIDPKRQLVIVRRDNVEHLILTGGPQDLLIESGIAVDTAAERRTGPVQVATNTTAPKPKANPFLEPDAEPMVPPVRNAMERLREFTRPLGQRPTSLRHTGLMRPIGKMDVIPGVLAARATTDSAKTAPVEVRGQTKVGDAVYPRDEAKAGGHQVPARGAS